MRRSTVLLLMIKVVLLLACQMNSHTSTVTVFNGNELPESSYPGIVGVRQPSGLACTGTVVGKGVVLTAAHCALAATVKVLNVQPDKIIRANDSGTAGETDLALLFFSDEKIANLPIIPIAKSAPQFADLVTIVGFGTDGVRRSGTNRLSAVGELMLIVSHQNQDESNIEPGDSGGPMLFNNQVVGVATGMSRNLRNDREGWFVSLHSETSQNLLKSAGINAP